MNNPILQKALANIPEGYRVVYRGKVRDTDLVWDLSKFVKFYSADIGEPVNTFHCVIRPIKPETKETF